MAASRWTKHIPSHVPSAARTHLTHAQLREYVIFSEATRGLSGKPVRIRVDLFLRFASLVDPKTHEGQTTIRQIENLRNAAGGGGSLSNASSSFKHMALLNNMQVFYSILDDVELGKKSVFISDIKPESGEIKDLIGLYAFNTSAGKYKQAIKPIDLTEKSVYISGNNGSLKNAISSANTRLDTSVKDKVIFFSPSDVINALGIWKKPGQASRNQTAQKELAKHMQFNANKRVYWVAEGEGAALVNDTVPQLTGTFPHFRMRFVNPITDTPSLIQRLKAKEIKVGGGNEDTSPITYTGDNRPAQIMLGAHAAALIAELSRLRVTPLNRDAHDDMVGKLQNELSTANGISTAQSNLNKPRAPHDTRPDMLRKHAAPAANIGLTFIAALGKL